MTATISDKTKTENRPTKTHVVPAVPKSDQPPLKMQKTDDFAISGMT